MHRAFFRNSTGFIRRRPILTTSLGAASLASYSILSSGPASDLDVDAESLYYGKNPLRMESADGTLDRPSTFWTPPSREEMLQKLGAPALESEEGKDGKSGIDTEKQHSDKAVANEDGHSGVGKGETAEPPHEAEGEFDLLIVGGGATGAGVALDAASRGLRVAVIERDDFSSGLSHSRSLRPFRGCTWLE